MKQFYILTAICALTLASVRGEIKPEDLLKQATQIVIGPTFGRAFDPATEAVARIRDKELIQEILKSAVGKDPEFVDHVMMLPHLQMAVLNEKGEIIAAYALDRTPAKNSLKSRVVLRNAQVVQTNGKPTIDFKDMFEGFPCKALEPYRFEDQEIPETHSEIKK